MAIEEVKVAEDWKRRKEELEPIYAEIDFLENLLVTMKSDHDYKMIKMETDFGMRYDRLKDEQDREIAKHQEEYDTKFQEFLADVNNLRHETREQEAKWAKLVSDAKSELASEKRKATCVKKREERRAQKKQVKKTREPESQDFVMKIVEELAQEQPSTSGIAPGARSTNDRTLNWVAQQTVPQDPRRKSKSFAAICAGGPVRTLEELDQAAASGHEP